MKAIVIGPDAEGLGAALLEEGVDVARVDGLGSRPGLEEAGVTDADALVLTDPAGATAIPIARDLNPDVRVVVYTDGDLPDFARGQADFIVDPAVLSPVVVAEELAA